MSKLVFEILVASNMNIPDLFHFILRYIKTSVFHFSLNTFVTSKVVCVLERLNSISLHSNNNSRLTTGVDVDGNTVKFVDEQTYTG